MCTLLNGEFAFSDSVPYLDVLVTATACNLAVVRGEGNAENVLGVADKASAGGSLAQIPQTKGVIP